MTDTGEIIRMCRKRLGWSKAYLGEKAGVSAGIIAYTERHTDCKMSVFEKLLDAMGYEIEILMKEE